MASNHPRPATLAAAATAASSADTIGSALSYFSARYGDRDDIALGVLVVDNSDNRNEPNDDNRLRGVPSLMPPINSGGGGTSGAGPSSLTSMPPRNHPHNHNHEGSLLPSTLPPPSHVNCSVEERQERVDSGQCPGCGQLLFKIMAGSQSNSTTSRKSKFFRRRKDPPKPSSSNASEESAAAVASGAGVTMVPLSIPGCVERGQCLRCCTAGATGTGNNNNSAGSLQSSANSLDLSDVVPTTSASALAKATSPATTTTSSSSFLSKMQWSGGNNSSSGSGHHNNHASGSSRGAPVSDDSFSDNPDDCGVAVATPSSLVSPHHTKTIVRPNSPPTTPPVSATAAAATATYQGSYNEYGERHGHGIMKWTNGDAYEGEFFNGVRHGQGSLFFADGSEYVGEWECNYMHGSGTRRFPNGDVYVGPYKDGKRSGNDGRFYFANGDLYVGPWNNDVMNGVGRYYYGNGPRFEGRFRDGKRHGPGKFQRVDGSLDQFLYLNDQRSGIGVHWSRSRTKAWKCDVSGNLKKKLTMEDAMTLAYDIDNTEC